MYRFKTLTGNFLWARHINSSTLIRMFWISSSIGSSKYTC
ncbi:MAG: hypothetical protein E5299_01401 [Burkholderia gladioli]|nr:MAG: hypothetical protein E5299_01401 [Burkholderia gladioli]